MEKTPKELRKIRESIYKENIKVRNIFPQIQGQRLSPAAHKYRTKNFKQFVKLYFGKIDYPGNRMKGSENYGFPTRLKPVSAGYKALERFAETDFGSSIVQEMVINRNKYTEFEIWESYKNQAKADYSSMLLPKTFPYTDRFRYSGQRVYDLAIIYHEFAHTMVYRPARLKDVTPTLQDERETVIYFENPVRMAHFYEPRYSYVYHDGSETINIITKKKKVGIWVVHREDPRILVRPSAEEALRLQ